MRSKNLWAFVRDRRRFRASAYAGKGYDLRDQESQSKARDMVDDPRKVKCNHHFLGKDIVFGLDSVLGRV
jgi:hypothetical protein